MVRAPAEKVLAGPTPTLTLGVHCLAWPRLLDYDTPLALLKRARAETVPGKGSLYRHPLPVAEGGGKASSSIALIPTAAL